jgi:hypothetical protein
MEKIPDFQIRDGMEASVHNKHLYGMPVLQVPREGS